MSPTPVSELGYEQCRDELVDVVRQLEQGGMNLDVALTLWERGEALARVAALVRERGVREVVMGESRDFSGNENAVMAAANASLAAG